MSLPYVSAIVIALARCIVVLLERIGVACAALGSNSREWPPFGRPLPSFFRSRPIEAHYAYTDSCTARSGSFLYTSAGAYVTQLVAHGRCRTPSDDWADDWPLLHLCFLHLNSRGSEFFKQLLLDQYASSSRARRLTLFRCNASMGPPSS